MSCCQPGLFWLVSGMTSVMSCLVSAPGSARVGLTWLTTPDITDVMPLTWANAAG